MGRKIKSHQKIKAHLFNKKGLLVVKFIKLKKLKIKKKKNPPSGNRRFFARSLILCHFQALRVGWSSNKCPSWNKGPSTLPQVGPYYRNGPFLRHSVGSTSRPPWTSTHQCTIHWMPVITQLWMKPQLS